MVKLWEDNIPGYDRGISEDLPAITPYLSGLGNPSGAIIVCPGGGYARRAPHEGEPVAKWLNSIGVSAFVLDYRVAPYKHPYPLMDAQRAIRTVRHNAKKWNIHPGKIGILGFSAGGHLASTAGTHFNAGNKDSSDPVEQVSSRPDAMILCYPVITFGEFKHHGSMVNLLGENPDPVLKNHLSNENSVSENTPPAFLWHTSEDASVPVENSLLFCSALRKNKIPFELHVFPQGRHGLGLAEDMPGVFQWPRLCENWLKSIGFID